MKKIMLWLMLTYSVSHYIDAGDSFSLQKVGEIGSFSGSVTSLCYWLLSIPKEMPIEDAFISRILLDALHMVTMYDAFTAGENETRPSKAMFFLNFSGSLTSGLLWTAVARDVVRERGWKYLFKTTVPFRIALDCVISATSVRGFVSPK
jgi:hypothetical protein